MEKYPISPIQRYCLLVSAKDDYGSDMNVGACLFFPIHLEPHVVIERIKECIGIHRSLNTKFCILDDGEIRQYIITLDDPVEYIDPSMSPKSTLLDRNLLEHYRNWYADRGISEQHADWVTRITSRNKHIKYNLYGEVPRRISLIGSPSEGYTVCMSFHHAMCDATSVSILHKQLKGALIDNSSPGISECGFLERCISDSERLTKLESNQISYWTNLLNDSNYESDISLIDKEARPCLLSEVHAVSIEGEDPPRKVTQFAHLCALYGALHSIGKMNSGNIISTIDNRRSVDEMDMVGCLFRHLIWHFPSEVGLDRSRVRKFMVAQGMRHYQNVDVTLDLIFNDYQRTRGKFPDLEIGFSFRVTSGGKKSESMLESEIVPQYMDALYERLKFHLHVQVCDDVMNSFAVYDPEWITPRELEKFQLSFSEIMDGYIGRSDLAGP